MAASSDSMWSDYEADYLFASMEASERRDQQDQLRRRLAPQVKEMLDKRAEKFGDWNLWSKHGLLRVYFANGSWMRLHPDMVRDQE